MRKTNQQLRLFIREALLQEDLPRKIVHNEKGENFIGKEASISPNSFVGNSTVGQKDGIVDTSTIDGESNVINSVIFKNSTVRDSDVNYAAVKSSTVKSRSRVEGVVLDSSHVSNSEIISSDAGESDFFGDMKMEMHKEILESSIENSYVEETHVDRSKVWGGSRLKNAHIYDSNVVGAEVSNVSLNYATVRGGSVKNTRPIPRDTFSGVEVPGDIDNATIENVDVSDSKIFNGPTIKCSPGSGAFIHLARIFGPVKITGAVKIAGLISPKDGHIQLAEVSGDAQVSENAEISGKVTGNAQVSGNAQIHGLATITGDCKVFGTAEMISGYYTKGVYSEGRHEGGDPPSYLQIFRRAIGTER